MVTKSEIRDEIYNLIRDRLVSQVKSVTLINSSTITIKNYYNEWNTNRIKTTSDLPIMIIEPPKFINEQLTFKKGKYSGTITISIYSKQKEAALKFIDKVDTSLDAYRRTLKSFGIEYFNISNEYSGSAIRDTNCYFQSIKYDFEVITSRW